MNELLERNWSSADMTREQALKMLATNRYVTVRVPPQPYHFDDMTRRDDYRRAQDHIRAAQQPFFSLFKEGLAMLRIDLDSSDPPQRIYEITREGLVAYRGAERRSGEGNG